MKSRAPSASSQLSASLAKFPPEIAALAKQCMPKLRRAFPGANQLVYNYSSSIVVSFGMSDRGYEGIISIAVLRNDVKLYFDKSLPDPKGLLEGSGSKVRSVSIKKASELDRGDIKALIAAAKKHSGVAFSRAPRTSRTIIKTQPKKRKSTKAKRKSSRRNA